jgi:hypothetical protein
VAVFIWLEAHSHLARIVEALVESPNRAFHRDLPTELAKLREFERKAPKLTLSGKMAMLSKKPIPHVGPT